MKSKLKKNRTAIVSMIALISGYGTFCLLLFSCTSRPLTSMHGTYIDFPQVQELKARTIPLDTALFRYPFRVHVNGNRAAVLDLHGTDHYFHVFSYPEFHYLTSFGKRGEAPDEMLSAENIRWSGKYIWTLDANKTLLTAFGFAVSGDTLLRQKEVKLSKDVSRALDFVLCKDSTFIIPDYTGDNRFCLVDPAGELSRKWGTIPSANEDALQHFRPALAQFYRLQSP